MISGSYENLPANVIRGKVLIPGGAFRKFHEFQSEGTKPRIFFVLNKCPERDNVILLATASTQIEKLKSKWPEEVLVEVSVYEYQELDYNSIISCEGARAFQKFDLEEWISNKQIEPLRPLPSFILDKVRKSVSKCRVLASIDKELVLGKEDIMD